MSTDKFGEYLRAQRTRKKMTLKDVAEKAGIHISTISRIERGEIDPALCAQLIPISSALGMAVVTILRNYNRQ